MRAIDEKRLIAMNEIKTKADAITMLANEYRQAYKTDAYTNRQKMDLLSDLWKLITENQIRLTEILRENGL